MVTSPSKHWTSYVRGKQNISLWTKAGIKILPSVILQWITCIWYIEYTTDGAGMVMPGYKSIFCCQNEQTWWYCPQVVVPVSREATTAGLIAVTLHTYWSHSMSLLVVMLSQLIVMVSGGTEQCDASRDWYCTQTWSAALWHSVAVLERMTLHDNIRALLLDCSVAGAGSNLKLLVEDLHRKATLVES